MFRKHGIFTFARILPWKKKYQVHLGPHSRQFYSQSNQRPWNYKPYYFPQNFQTFKPCRLLLEFLDEHNFSQFRTEMDVNSFNSLLPIAVEVVRRWTKSLNWGGFLTFVSIHHGLCPLYHRTWAYIWNTHPQTAVWRRLPKKSLPWEHIQTAHSCKLQWPYISQENGVRKARKIMESPKEANFAQWT